jgi:hypothetical protein
MAEKAAAMTSESTLSIKQSKVRAILGEAASGCGGLLNSVMVVLGDRFELYRTGQYSTDMDQRAGVGDERGCRCAYGFLQPWSSLSGFPAPRHQHRPARRLSPGTPSPPEQ